MARYTEELRTLTESFAPVRDAQQQLDA